MKDKGKARMQGSGNWLPEWLSKRLKQGRE
nr:MAG TPA: hypothetical protein [Caudoviricetes sp.]